jgi:HlyD family secretion protein
VSPKKKKSKAKIWIILAVVVVVGGLVTANFMTKRGPKALEVDVAEAATDSLVQTVTASGKVQPKTDVNISSNVSGQILYLGGEEGDAVEKGALLVRIEDEQYRADVEQMEYLLRSYEASLEENQSKLKRVQELAASKLASQSELEAASAAVKRLEADVERTRAQLGQTRDRFEKTRIYSPLEGIITRLSKEVGEMAIGSQFSQDIIMIVSRLDSMEVEVEVNENDVVLVELGDAVEVEVFAMPDTTFSGYVAEIAHSGTIRGSGSAEEVTNFMVTVAISDYVSSLRPGMSATVDIVTEMRPHAVVLPQEAVAVRLLSGEERFAEMARSGDNEGGNDEEGDEGHNGHGSMQRGGEKEDPVEVVFIVKNDTVWAKQVTLGIYSDTHFEIVSGLDEGELVVTGPFRVLSRELHSGTVVEFQEPFKPDEDSDVVPGDSHEGVELADDDEDGASTEVETADASAS